VVSADVAPATDEPFEWLSRLGYAALVRSGSPLGGRAAGDWNLVIVKPNDQEDSKKKRSGLRPRRAGELTVAHLSGARPLPGCARPTTRWSAPPGCLPPTTRWSSPRAP
jgi:hypothetical protein